MRALTTICCLLMLCLPCGVQGAEEGSRHITGSGVDVYFMHDKVFGVVEGHPLWALYDCGSAIQGEMDIHGTYHPITFKYYKETDRIVAGTFGPVEMSLHTIEKRHGGVVYHVRVGSEEYRFKITYTKRADEHMVNSIIEGNLSNGRSLRLVVDGPLCPFATTGIILIVTGAAALS